MCSLTLGRLRPDEWEARNRQLYGEDRSKWQPALKILVLCNMLLTGFDAPIEQVLYLDKPLRDHNLLEATARTNRPLPALRKECGLVVDFFGVFAKVEKALNFSTATCEEVLLDWDKLRSLVKPQLAECLAFFDGIARTDTRECYRATGKRLRSKEVAQRFKSAFNRLETLWEAISPDAMLYELGRDFAWLCGVYVSYRRSINRSPETREALAVKTREIVRQHSTFLDVAEKMPVFVIDADYVVKTRKLLIGDHGRLVGTLHYDRTGAREHAAFAYDATWLAAPDIRSSSSTSTTTCTTMHSSTPSGGFGGLLRPLISIPFPTRHVN